MIKDLHRHDHFLRFPESIENEAHLIVKTLHPVLTSAHVLIVLVINKLSTTNFTKEPSCRKVD
jgi:hypothetical protein